MTGRRIRLGLSTISWTAALWVWMSCCSGVSLRQVVPRVFTRLRQPQALLHSCSLAELMPAFL